VYDIDFKYMDNHKQHSHLDPVLSEVWCISYSSPWADSSTSRLCKLYEV